MSGDVQPRKRKEKRRKKDDEDSGTPPPTLVNPAEHASDNVTIHVYKEGSTGGHWCAKIIFFALFTALIGVVGVIIFEHRGTTDVDTPVASSKWAVIFEGWVDDVFPFYDDEGHKEHDGHGSNEVEHDEEDAHEEEEDHEEEEEAETNELEESHDEENDEQGEDEENAIDEDDDNVESKTTEVDDDDEEETAGDDEQMDSRDADDDNEEQEDAENENSEDNQYEEVEEGDEEEEEEAQNESQADADDVDDADEDDADDANPFDEVDQSEEEAEEEDDRDDNMDDDENITNLSAADLDISIEGVGPSSKEIEEDDVFEYVNIPGIDDIDNDSNEPLEEIEEEEVEEEIMNEIEIEPVKTPEEQEEEETASVAVKFGVGVALVVAAHFVLVRRWKNVDDSQLADLSRRNTIIPPSNPKKLIVTGDNLQKQQHLKNFQDLKPQYKNISDEMKAPIRMQSKDLNVMKNISKKDEIINIPIAKQNEQDTYTSESERFSQESEYDEEDFEDEDVQDEEEEDEEIEEVDDRELVAKLEEKYGKLPTPSPSEEEMEEDMDEEEDEEMDEEEPEELEDEDDEPEDIGDWKRINAQHPSASIVEKSKNKNPKEATRLPVEAPRSSRQSYEFIEPIDYNDVNIQEEIGNWIARDLDN